MQRLDGLVADALLRYLGKWLRKLLVSEKVTLQARRALPFGMVLPTISQVVNWMALTMDCHMTRLLQQKSCRKVQNNMTFAPDCSCPISYAMHAS